MDDWNAYDRKGAPPSYWVKITGAGTEKVQALYRAIRAGTVRPTESWEGSQSGLSTKELENRLDISERYARDLGIELNTLRAELVELKKQQPALAQ
ncbi:MAG: hypothetical protein UX81_C0019G0001 [Parcubacteria group bacterium GW2011_GWA2_47_12]|nr:MAG: hypothetical protein UX81_C0019G0001 [Parcubacteria group bacterium GW2011_GWA2_47_12]